MIFIAVAAALSLPSCKGFLDSFPSYAVDPSVSVTDSVAIALVNGCYTPLQSSNLYNQRIWSLDIIAGNSEVGAGGGDDGIETIQVANFAADAANGFALYIWRSPWVGIGQCNTAIQALLNGNNPVSDGIRSRSLGEAYFLRAHYYYILVRLFGRVPVITTPHNADESTDIPRAKSIDENYALIMDDCLKAVERLPVKSSYGPSDHNRVCKEAALAMLADVYLTYKPMEHYSDVVSLCEQIEALGYDLSECDFADNFGTAAKNSREALFTVGYSGDTQYDFWGGTCQSSWLSTFMGPRNSGMVAGAYGWNQPTEEFMGQWESGDLRKDVTVFYRNCPPFDGKVYKPTWSNTGYNVRKFLVTKADSPEYNTNAANFVVYRFADVLLKKAEALNELGRMDEAVVPLNKVRSRAGLAPVPKGQVKETLRETIIHERRMELAFEGHRWFDMLRVDDGEYALKFLSSIGRKPTKERLLLPIPLTETDSNNAMKNDQNPGY